jgi:hypothetical protein
VLAASAPVFPPVGGALVFVLIMSYLLLFSIIGTSVPFCRLRRCRLRPSRLDKPAKVPSFVFAPG